MEQLIDFDGLRVLLTTAENYRECQNHAMWDAADVVVSVDDRGAMVLKGPRWRERVPADIARG